MMRLIYEQERGTSSPMGYHGWGPHPGKPPRLAQQAHEPYPSPCPRALRAIGSNGSTSRCFVYASAFVYLFSGLSYWGYGQCK